MSHAVVSTTGIADVKASEDFFARGMDSVQVIQIARYLKGGLEKGGIRAHSLASSTIYTHPTIVKLTLKIIYLAQEARASTESNGPIDRIYRSPWFISS